MHFLLPAGREILLLVAVVRRPTLLVSILAEVAFPVKRSSLLFSWQSRIVVQTFLWGVGLQQGSARQTVGYRV